MLCSSLSCGHFTEHSHRLCVPPPSSSVAQRPLKNFRHLLRSNTEYAYCGVETEGVQQIPIITDYYNAWNSFAVLEAIKP